MTNIGRLYFHQIQVDFSGSTIRKRCALYPQFCPELIIYMTTPGLMNNEDACLRLLLPKSTSDSIWLNRLLSVKEN